MSNPRDPKQPGAQSLEEQNRIKNEQDALLKAASAAGAARAVNPDQTAPTNSTNDEAPQKAAPKNVDPPKSMAAKVIAGLKNVFDSQDGIIYINLFGKGGPQVKPEKTIPSQSSENPQPVAPKEPERAQNNAQVVQPDQPNVAVKATAEIESETKSVMQQTAALKPDKEIPPQVYVGGNDPNKKSEPPKVTTPTTAKLPDASSTKSILEAASKVAAAVAKMTEEPPKVVGTPSAKLPEGDNRLLAAASSTAKAVAAMEKSANDGGLGNQVNISAEAKASEPKPVENRQKLADVAKLIPDETNDQTLLEAKRERKEEGPSSPRPGGGGLKQG